MQQYLEHVSIITKVTLAERRAFDKGGSMRLWEEFKEAIYWH